MPLHTSGWFHCWPFSFDINQHHNNITSEFGDCWRVIAILNLTWLCCGRTCFAQGHWCRWPAEPADGCPAPPRPDHRPWGGSLHAQHNLRNEQRTSKENQNLLYLHLSLNCESHWGTTDNLTTSFLHFFCSPLPSGTWRTPGLSTPWCCLPTSSSVCLVFFPLLLCLARWFWSGLMNGRRSYHCNLIMHGQRVSCSPIACWILAR